MPSISHSSLLSNSYEPRLPLSGDFPIVQPTHTSELGGFFSFCLFYVGELDPTITEAMLFEIFNMIGLVARYVIVSGF
jgi:hypothetical protein